MSLGYEKVMTVKTAGLNTLSNYTFVVIICRYRDKWLYCRAEGSDAFGNAGGHIEEGETALEAAKRELYEETGALEYNIVPVFDYSVENFNEYSSGQVFLAHINKLGKLPRFEIVEIRLFEALPDKMRFPLIQPELYKRMQIWLNLHSAKDEIWDVYDSKRNFTGRTHRRIDPLPEGDYHIVVFVWLRNSKGEYLITKRAPNKGDPNLWENTGGSAIAGDDSLSAAVREVKEEVGLDVNPENGKLISSIISEDSFFDVWLFQQDFNIDDVVLQENETVDAKYADIDDIKRMIENGEFISVHHDLDLLQL